MTTLTNSQELLVDFETVNTMSTTNVIKCSKRTDDDIPSSAIKSSHVALAPNPHTYDS